MKFNFDIYRIILFCFLVIVSIIFPFNLVLTMKLQTLFNVYVFSWVPVVYIVTSIFGDIIYDVTPKISFVIISFIYSLFIFLPFKLIYLFIAHICLCFVFIRLLVSQ